jgi:hypothetical protein
MAQTKRKRRTKHRGTPAGTIESRGRTGRKLTDAERKGKGTNSKATSQQRRADRMNQAPTWQGAAQRAAIATVILIAFLILAFKQDPPKAFLLGAFALVVYIPMGYYTDMFMYRRRQQKQLLERAEKKKPK